MLACDLQRYHSTDAVAAHVEPLQAQQVRDQQDVLRKPPDSGRCDGRPTVAVSGECNNTQGELGIEGGDHAVPLLTIAEATGDENESWTRPFPVRVGQAPILKAQRAGDRVRCFP